MQGVSVRTIDFSEKEQEFITPLQFITSKPVLYVCNVDESSVSSTNKHVDSVKELIDKEGAELIILAAVLNLRLMSLKIMKKEGCF